MLIDQLYRHPITSRPVFTGSRLSSSTSNLPFSVKREPFQNGPRETREQVYAKRNRALLMYSSAVVRLSHLTSKRQLKSHDYLDSNSYRCLLRSSSTISHVLCRDWFCRNAKSGHRSIWAVQTCSSRECPPDKGPFQRRSFWSASLVISSPAEVCERTSGRVKFSLLHCKKYVGQRYHWNCNLQCNARSGMYQTVIYFVGHEWKCFA